ncbi:hypothetical protein NQ176_g11434 [Zarea fungicola]|uniref:Uncharacterized protein n=1 Tax=Zarea fungicola TaxID=93591 RepID=A0ACC1MA55_9HYPO|nr:hypothetical protein NQ176_g11434 [Lecanicillium fungicola]
MSFILVLLTDPGYCHVGRSIISRLRSRATVYQHFIPTHLIACIDSHRSRVTIMAEPGYVKPENENEPAPIDEEDPFEDAGDLEFYDKNLASTFETLYLARIPRYMWEAWQKLTDRLDDDEEVQLCTQ